MDVTELCSGSFERRFVSKHVVSTEWAIVPSFAPIRLGFFVYAENFNPASIEVEFTPQDIDYEARGAKRRENNNLSTIL
jgi:hypothetical protein